MAKLLRMRTLRESVVIEVSKRETSETATGLQNRAPSYILECSYAC